MKQLRLLLLVAVGLCAAVTARAQISVDVSIKERFHILHEPIIATAEDPMRPLEIAGNVGIVLAGAFPLVYAIRTYASKPLGAIGRRFGISPEGTAGVLAAAANMLAAFHLGFFSRFDDRATLIALAAAASAAGLLQALALLPALRKEGYRPRFAGPLAGMTAVPVLLAAAPAAFTLAQDQVSMLINTVYASFLPAGAVTAMIFGFWLARVLPVWASFALFVLAEAITIYMIRDGLILNVLMLVWPLEAVRNWQAAG